MKEIAIMQTNCPRHGEVLGAFCGLCDPRGVGAAFEEERRQLIAAGLEDGPRLVAEVELTAKQMAHVQERMKEEKAPNPRMAASVEKMRRLLKEGLS